MNIDIPFIGDVSDREQQDWIKSINAQACHFKLVALKDLKKDAAQKAEVAIVANPDPAILNQLPNLKWIQSLWAGVEGILQSALCSSISVVRLTDPQMAESMAEAVLAWTLYLHRKMPHYRTLQTKQQWQQLSLSTPQACNVSIFGLGTLGSQAAIRLHQNQFTVRGWSTTKKTLDGIESYSGLAGLDQILPLTDIAVVLLPLTKETDGFFNQSRLETLATGAAIINFARGPIVPATDLINCLNSNHLDHAVLDVFNVEPLPQDNPLWTHPDVTVLPHISAPTTVSTAAVIAAKNIDHYFESGQLPATVDRKRGY